MKHVQKMMLVPEHLLQSLETEHRLTSPPQLATLTRLDQDMKQIMDSSLPEDQEISLLDQLLHRYQGLSKQMKSKATVKPTVTRTVSPAPTETSPTSPPTMPLEPMIIYQYHDQYHAKFLSSARRTIDLLFL